MKAAAQSAFIAPASALTLAPAWRLKAVRRQPVAKADAATAETYSRHSLIAAGDREDRVTGTLEIVTHFALVSSLLCAMGQCAWMFLHF